MKALSEIKMPKIKGTTEQERCASETNQFLLNKNFKQLLDAVLDLEERVKMLESRV